MICYFFPFVAFAFCNRFKCNKRRLLAGLNLLRDAFEERNRRESECDFLRDAIIVIRRAVPDRFFPSFSVCPPLLQNDQSEGKWFGIVR